MLSPARALAVASWTTLALSACEAEKVAELVDSIPPGTQVELNLSGGRTLVHPAGTPVISRADRVQLTIRADEPCEIVYTIDGTTPELGDLSQPRGGRAITITVSDDTEVRWLAVDTAGNVGEPGAVEVRFDKVAPDLQISPEGGDFGGPIEVEIAADEPVTLWYTTNGRWPVAGTEGTVEAEAPVSLRLERSTELNVIAQDEAGNRTERGPIQFTVDTEAPSTVADPPGGWYPNAVEVDLVSDDGEAEVHYTVDGSDPDEASPVWPGPQRFERDTELRFRAVDAGGNLEPVQVAAYDFGPRPAPPRVRLDADLHDTAAGLQLAAALIRASGPLGGGSSFGADWLAWASGRAAADAVLFRAGVGPHALHAPAHVSLATSGGGQPDANENGTNLDDSWWHRADLFAAAVGATVPDGLHPVTLPFVRARARRLANLDRQFQADGRPITALDYRAARWEGARVNDKRWTPAAAAAGLAAYVARAEAGLRGRHAGGDAWSDSAGPVVGLRCAGCHHADGPEPALDTAAAVVASGLVVAGAPDDSRLVRFFEGAGDHPIEPVPAARIAAVRRWITEGAVAIESAPRLGTTGQEALLGLLAWDTVGFAVDHLAQATLIDPATGAVAAADDPGPAYPAALFSLAEGAVAGGLPRRIDQIRVDDRAFEVAEVAELVGRLAELVVAGRAQARLFADGPLAQSAAPDRAASLLARVVPALLARALPSGGFPARWRPGAVTDQRVDTVATAQVLWALRHAAAANVAGTDAAATAALGALRGLRDAQGHYVAGQGADGLEVGTPRTLRVQLTVLRALQADPDGGALATTLWQALEAGWWDELAGAWATTWGTPAYSYDPALAGLAFAALGEGRHVQADPGQLASFFYNVVWPMLVAETWLTGEVAPGVDADGDGLANPESARVGDEQGFAPVFTGRIEF